MNPRLFAKYLTESGVSAALADAGMHPGAEEIEYTDMIVVAKNGNDETGDGSFNKPYLTVGKAFSTITTSGKQVLVAGGTYAESPTLDQTNVTVMSFGLETGGFVLIKGALNLTHTDGSVRLSGITCDTINHTGAGGLYLTHCKTNLALNSSGGYMECFGSDTQGPLSTGTINLSGAGDKAFYAGCKNGIMSITGTGFVTVSGILNAYPVTQSNGTLVLGPGFYYPVGAGFALTSTGGAVILSGAEFTTAAGAPAKISITGAANYQVRRASYDQVNSVFSGNKIPNAFMQDESISLSAKNAVLYDNWTGVVAAVPGVLNLVANAAFNKLTTDARLFEKVRFYVSYLAAGAPGGTLPDVYVGELSVDRFTQLTGVALNFAIKLSDTQILRVSYNSATKLNVVNVPATGTTNLLRVEGVY